MLLELELVSIGRAGLSFREKFMISCNRWKEKKTEMTKLILIRGYGRGEIVEEKDWRRNISNPFLIISFQSTVASPNGVSGRYVKTLVEDL